VSRKIVPLPDPPLGDERLFAALALAGGALAALLVSVGVGWEGGWGGPDTQVFYRRLLRQSWWRVPAQLAFGLGLHRFYGFMLREKLDKSQEAGLTLLGVARMCLNFIPNGTVVLFSTLIAFFQLIYRGCVRFALGRRPPADEIPPLDRWIGVPLWLLTLPMVVLRLPYEGEVSLPRTVSRRALLREQLPALALVVLLLSGAFGGSNDERPDPVWLTFFAGLWLADHLAVALRVTPILRARRGLAP
jgi:hypothetical protein